MKNKDLVIGVIAGAYPNKRAMQQAIYAVISGAEKSAYAAEATFNLPDMTVKRAVKKVQARVEEAQQLQGVF